MRDIAGQKFGRLTALRHVRSYRDPKCPGGRTRPYWACLCDCGKEHNAAYTALTQNKTTSCGCWRHEKWIQMRTKHNQTGSPEYRSWNAIKTRCFNTGNKLYPYYGGRGITMCERWRFDFSAFLQDMGTRPSLKHSIDRINNNGNYEPGNCRWATRSEQMRNRRPFSEWVVKHPRYKRARTRALRVDQRDGS